MTREELIDFGEMFLKVNNHLKNSGTYEFIDAAVKLFKREPCKDVVDRKALHQALYDRFHDEDAPNNITEVRLGAVRNFVREFPTADVVERKKILDFIEDNRPTDIQTDWERGCAYICDAIEVIKGFEKARKAFIYKGFRCFWLRTSPTVFSTSPTIFRISPTNFCVYNVRLFL